MTEQETARVPRVAGMRAGRHRHPDDTPDDAAGVAPAGEAPGGAASDAAGAAAATDAGRHQSAAPKPPDGQPPDQQPPGQGRAGRNLPAAIGIGLALGAAIVASLLLYRPSFGYIVGAAIGYGIIELVVAIRTVEARPPLVPLLVGGLAMQVAAWFRGPSGLVMALLVTICAVVVWRLADGARGYLGDVTTAALVLLYLPLLGGFAVLLAHEHDGAARVMLFIGAVVCSDTGGYAAGVLTGRHPLAPTISKGKTWEGFAGSVVACCLCGALVMHFTFHHPWWQGVLFGLAMACTATLGDLGESMIKRDLGLKDMGRLLPGHGGLMDRLDSLLPCAAVAYLVLAGFLSG